MKNENSSRRIRISSVVLNCGALAEKLEKAMKLLELVSGLKPIKTKSRKRIPGFGIRPGLEIGCKVTIKGNKSSDLLKRLLTAVSNQLNKKQIGNGNLSFGIHEYIEIPGIQFQRAIGIMGFDVSVNFQRQGYSIERRKHARSKVPLRHKVTKQETIKFMEENFNIKII